MFRFVRFLSALSVLAVVAACESERARADRVIIESLLESRRPVSAVLVPSRVHVETSTVIEFEVEVRTRSGSILPIRTARPVLPGDPVSTQLVVEVAWSSPDPAVGVRPGGIRARVAAPDVPGDYRLDATVTFPESGDPRIESLAASEVFKVSAGLGRRAAATFDRAIVGSDPTTPTAVLVQGAEEGGPEIREWAFDAVGAVSLETNVVPRTVGGSTVSEMVAYGAGHAARTFGFVDAEPAWTTTIETLEADPLPDYGFRSIPVWLALPESGFGVDEAKLELDTARQLFEKNRVGLDLDLAGTFTHTRAGKSESSGVACDATGLLVDTDLGPGRSVKSNGPEVYVVFVPKIEESVKKGFTCSPTVTGWTNGVIYIAYDHAEPSTLAHEMVHLLGHHVGAMDVYARHTDGDEGFTSTNVMWTGSGPGRTHLSLGQSYRMNFHASSWLNLQLLAGSPDLLRTRACQLHAQSTGGDPCPPLKTDPSDTGPSE